MYNAVIATLQNVVCCKDVASVIMVLCSMTDQDIKDHTKYFLFSLEYFLVLNELIYVIQTCTKSFAWSSEERLSNLKTSEESFLYSHIYSQWFYLYFEQTNTRVCELLS